MQYCLFGSAASRLGLELGNPESFDSKIYHQHQYYLHVDLRFVDVLTTVSEVPSFERFSEKIQWTIQQSDHAY